MTIDTLSLAMGGISEVKVENFDKLVHQAEHALTSQRLSDENRELIVKTLDQIKATADHEVTPDMVEDIDDTIRNVATYTVKDDGNVTPVVIEGTENFSYTLLPSEWKQSRIEGCEALLVDLSKSIARWAKQLREKTQELWTTLRYNLDGLNTDIKAIDGRLAEIENEQPTIPQVLIPKRLCKALAGNNKAGIDAPRADERIKNDVLYIFTIIKVWQLESTDFKNRLIRFFGNPEKQKYSFLSRKHPAFFSKKMFHDEHVMDIVYWSPPNPLIGYGNITFSEHGRKVENLEDLAHTLDETGYGIVSSEKTVFFDGSYKDTEMSSLNTSKLDKLYQIVTKISSILETLAERNNSFNLNENDIKDIIGTLNGGKNDYNEHAEIFNRVASHYQDNTFSMQTGLFRYLYNLAGYLIEFMSLHIEAYNGA